MLVEATRKGEGEEKRRSRVTRGRRQERGRARAMYAEEGPAAAAAGWRVERGERLTLG